MPAVVETEKLTKAYNGVKVVDGLNLQIQEGEIFGFLGPNGSGKTTTILMLLGLTEPTSGTACVAGFNSTREPLKVKRITGYVPEKVGFYEDMTATQNVSYTARLNRVPEQQVAKMVADVLDIVGLKEKVHQNVSTFSKGMKQRLAIADILVKAPKLAFLDEPTSGIDPEGVNHMLDLIKKIASEHNMTIVMSSHQLHQVERICHRVGIMSKGKMVVEGAIDQLGRKTLAGGKYKVEVELSEATVPVIEAIKKIKGVLAIEQSGCKLVVTCVEDLRPQIARAIVDNNGLLVQMKIQSYALEDIYLKYFKEG